MRAENTNAVTASVRRALQDVEASRESYRALFELAPVGYVCLDQTGGILEANELMAAMLNLPQERLRSARLSDFLRPTDQPSLARHFEEARATRVIQTGKLELIPFGATPFPVRVETVAVSGADGTRGFFRTVVIDITQCRQAEEQMRRSESRFRQITENLDVVVWLTDTTSGEVLHVSQAYERIWGRPRQTVYDDPESWCKAIHPEDRVRVRNAFDRDANLGRYDEEYRVVAPDGAIRWVRDREFAIHSVQGSVSRTAGITEDITERKEMEEARRRADRLDTLGVLTAGIAHDFNALLALVSRKLETMRTSMQPHDRSHADLEVARQAVRQASGMTRALEACVRQAHSEKRVVSLGEMCRDASALLRHLIGVTVVQVWEIPDTPLYVLADRTQIQQVLMNLVANARDAMPKGGTVRVSMTPAQVQGDVSPACAHGRPGRYARLDVTDTGTGMSDNVKARIFEPLFTTHQATPHTGLGLAIAQRVIHDHEGWIEVESRVGAGSTFSLFLPCRDDGDQVNAEEEEALWRAPPGAGALVVEEDELERSVMATTLRDAGYEVVQARSTANALHLLSTDAALAQVVVIGAGLADMTGAECFRRLRAVSSELRGVLVATSRSQRDLVAEAKRLACPVLFKPFQARDLARHVTRLVTGKEDGR